MGKPMHFVKGLYMLSNNVADLALQ